MCSPTRLEGLRLGSDFIESRSNDVNMRTAVWQKTDSIGIRAVEVEVRFGGTAQNRIR